MQRRHRTAQSVALRAGLRVAFNRFRGLLLVLAMLGVGLVHAASNVVQYTYDAAGNITQIQRQTPAGFAITSFTPASGPAGTAVTIYGAGFSATPASNTLTFNGTAAIVSASDTGSISTTVPAGATTGRIAVTVGGSTAVSATDFVVTIPGAPTIASFTPTSAAAGASIAVNGSNYDATAGATVVKLNGVVASATVSTATDLSFVVPSAAASGRIAATTAVGTGSSATDFIVPPPGLSVTDIASSGRVSAGGSSANVSVVVPGKSALVLFDGVAGAYDSIELAAMQTSPTTATVAYMVVRPDNSVLASGTVGGTFASSIHLPPLPATGTYSLVLSPGTATLNVGVRVETAPVLTVDGPAVASSMDAAGQSERFVFNATTGQRLGLGLTGLAFMPSTGSVTSDLGVFQPSGAKVNLNTPCNRDGTSNPQGNCDTEFLAPVTGTYTIVLASPTSAYGNGSLMLNSEVTGTLAIDAPQAVTLARVGQDARYAFGVASGDSLAVDISGFTQSPQARSVWATISKPDGTALSSCSAVPPGSFHCELGTLSTAGSYSIYLDPDKGAYGSFNLAIQRGATLTTTGTATSFAPASTAETARFTFSATTGQSFSLAVANLANVGGGSSNSTLAVYRPDVGVVRTLNCFPSLGGCRLRFTNVPVSGTYSVALSPPSATKITGNITLSDDTTGTLTSGTAQTISTRLGQAAQFTFAGTTGQGVSVKLLGVSTSPSGNSLTMTVYKPDGTVPSGGSASGIGALTVNLSSLPATGTYTVLVEPGAPFTWQAQLELDPLP